MTYVGMRSVWIAVGLAISLGGAIGVSRASEPVATDDEAPTSFMLRLKIERDGRTLEHPGLKADFEHEHVAVLTETQGDKKRKHEVVISLEPVGKDKVRAQVSYTDNGQKVLGGNAEIAHKAWGKVGDGKGSAVHLRVDPSGSRGDGIDLPDGNDPLDGLK